MRRVDLRMRLGAGLVVSSVLSCSGMDVTNVVELDPLAPDEARTMRFCTAHELHALWERAGLHDVATGEIVVAAEYADFDDYWTPFESGIGPSGAYVAALSSARRDTFRTACFRRLGSPPGPFRLDARAWFVRGAVPGSLSRTSGRDR